ncbi:hypothetical protein DES53_108274 [Roseimicrobium gellanilyticum]|uniref:Uncharacterized protein n=1 Tax=Roseimicrobium gellanilyticum TaxID=748857 RepID=A0A366HDW5_9BACT|nr:hypothetical protein [Roseimicrobium gellanilyticum]RBP40567.1 hypothetical protein DES53_108274 [Roseimicrobium gellanilyticum]
MIQILPDLAHASQTTLLIASLSLSVVLSAIILRWPRMLWLALVIAVLFGLAGAPLLTHPGYRYAVIHERGMLYFLSRALLFALPLLVCCTAPLLGTRRTQATD